jgi:hypothetical protein
MVCFAHMSMMWMNPLESWEEEMSLRRHCGNEWVQKKVATDTNQWLRQYDEQQMTDNTMITIDDMT